LQLSGRREKKLIPELSSRAGYLLTQQQLEQNPVDTRYLAQPGSNHAT